MAKLVLFEVNKLLARDMKDVSEYVEEVIRSRYSIIAKVNLDDYEGKTSQEIAEAILSKNGMPQKDINEKMEKYINDLTYSYYNVAGHDRHQLLDGAKEILKDIKGKGALLGIATGEAKGVVDIRLEKTGLNGFFEVGAYANDGRSYDKIINAGMSKARHMGMQYDQVFIISPYPEMISAAKAFGVDAIGVATAKYSKQELASAGADIAVNNLKARNQITGFIFK